VFKRIVVGLALLPPLFYILYFAPGWGLPAVLAIVAPMAVSELLDNSPFVPKKRLMVYPFVFAAGLPVWRYFTDGNRGWLIFLAGVTCLLLVLFFEAVQDHRTVTLAHVCVLFAAALFIPLFLTSLIQVAAYGKQYILLPFIVALLGDTFAYFVGVCFGKGGRKLKPDISPKKTVIGAVGGLLGALLGIAAYGLIIQSILHYSVNYPVLLLYGFLGNVAAQLGDLSMSLVKREFGIKDFSSLLPGHGGILDRIDSILFAAPVMEILIALLPAFGVAAV